MVVFFNRKYKFDRLSVKKLRMGGKEVIPTTEMTYLGVMLDHKLTWIPHVRKKIANIRKFMFAIKPVINHSWGLQPKNVAWIYNAMVIPKLVYAAHAWGH